jgi:hypothetical protein
MADELPSAQLATVDPAVLRIDIPHRLNRLQAIEHRHPLFLGRQEITKCRFPWAAKHWILSNFRSLGRGRVARRKPKPRTRVFFRGHAKNSIAFTSLGRLFVDPQRQHVCRDAVCSERGSLWLNRFRPASYAGRRIRRFPPARKMHDLQNP